jgi:hypothetical protein
MIFLLFSAGLIVTGMLKVTRLLTQEGCYTWCKMSAVGCRDRRSGYSS